MRKRLSTVDPKLVALRRTAWSPKPDSCASPFLISLMGLALISLGTNDSYGQNSDRIVGPRLYVEEVLPNWDYYQGYSLYIEGTFECLTELYCDFVPVQGQARIVWVNITMLTTGEKRQLRDDCNASCDVVVFGQVNLTNIMASEIRKIEKK